ncbi:DUF4435 domain-containing protein [Pseudomonas syringae pv. syringae]|uniref:DUF4435 domain-containing protein n=1 Tax=Pseudomonas syringae TaxID=317 RepID=UPI002340C778|nr:DUF4435 domain-containing protein [Pseudomonas syringae]MDC3741323.1 DUF4435 domain-containing protein [Pseudomonas syringae pv. syringae]
MTVTRSAKGIANYKVLYRVDLVIYSEGGNAELLRSNPESYIYSIDSEFWGALFEKIDPETKVRIKSLGSKNNVLPYADKISSGVLKDCVVVLDRDHDDHKGIMIDHPRVIYTRGYSWENDAWCSISVIKALSLKHPKRALGDDVVKSIELRYDSFAEAINRLVFVDVICSCQNIEGIPGKFGEVVNVYGGVEPSVNKARLKSIITSAKLARVSPLRYHGRRRINPLSDCYGKLFAEFAYGVFSHHYQIITGKGHIVRDHADQLMAKSLADLDSARDEVEVAEYYRVKISKAIDDLPKRRAI